MTQNPTIQPPAPIEPPARLYLSGPMTGIPLHNFPAFNRAADRLRARGFTVVNPVDINEDPALSWQECLRSDIHELARCEVLVLLPGWEGSSGANLEVHVAHRLGLRIVALSDLLADGGLSPGDVRLRTLLAMKVCGPLLYADDGELQDNTARPTIDFLRDTPQQIEEKLYARGVAACHAHAASSGKTWQFDLLAHLRRQIAFSIKTFGPGTRMKGVTDHIRKELIEVEKSGGDLGEWIDVIILAFDGACRCNATSDDAYSTVTPEQIVAALTAKLTRNEGRSWPDWRGAPTDRAIEHVRA